jgi:hypothetical protein
MKYELFTNANETIIANIYPVIANHSTSYPAFDFVNGNEWVGTIVVMDVDDIYTILDEIAEDLFDDIDRPVIDPNGIMWKLLLDE